MLRDLGWLLRTSCKSPGGACVLGTTLTLSRAAPALCLAVLVSACSSTSVNAAVFLAVLALTGGRNLRRAAGLDDHVDPPTGAVPLVGALR